MARTPFAAVSAYTARLQRLLSCVTSEVLVISRGGYQPADAPHQLMLGGGTPVRLRAEIGLFLSIRMFYRIVATRAARGPWQFETVAYYYWFDDADGREILAYHWHPDVPGVVFPHLHVGHGAVSPDVLVRAQLSINHNALRADFAGAHLPTGRIALESVLWLAITQFGVRPLHPDWEEILPEPAG